MSIYFPLNSTKNKGRTTALPLLDLANFFNYALTAFLVATIATNAPAVKRVTNIIVLLPV